MGILCLGLYRLKRHHLGTVVYLGVFEATSRRKLDLTRDSALERDGCSTSVAIVGSCVQAC